MSKAQLLLPVPGLIVVACRSGHILPIYTQISTRVGTLITSTDDHSTVSILVSPYHIMPTSVVFQGSKPPYPISQIVKASYTLMSLVQRGSGVGITATSLIVFSACVPSGNSSWFSSAARVVGGLPNRAMNGEEPPSELRWLTQQCASEAMWIQL